MAAQSDHQRLDQRSIALHAAVRDLVVAKPEVINIALANLDHWEQSSPGPWIDAWRELLLGPRRRLLELLVEDSQQAQWLRQSSPFAGVLDQATRRRIYESHAA